MHSESALTASITPPVLNFVTLAEAEQEYVKEIHRGEFHPDVVVKLLKRVHLHLVAALEGEEWQARARPKGEPNLRVSPPPPQAARA